MSIDTIYGEVRALVQSKAVSTQTFGKVCALVEQAFELDAARTCGELVPFIDNYISRWPAHTRRCPLFWEKRLRTQHEHPYPPLDLIRHVVIDYRWAPYQIRGLGESRLARLLESVHIGYAEDMNAQVRAFAEGTEYVNVRALEIRDGTLSRGTSSWLEELPGWSHAHTLESLEIFGYHTGKHHPGLEDFGSAFCNLRELVWSEGSFEPDTLSAMLSSSDLGQLRRVDTGKRSGFDIKLLESPSRLNLLGVGAVDLGHLFGAGWFTDVTHLSITSSHLRQEQMEEVFDTWAATGVTHLESITLKRCQISEEVARSIATHIAPTLREFRASKTKYQHDARQVLVDAEWSASSTTRFE